MPNSIVTRRQVQMGYRNPWLANLAAYYKLDGNANDSSGNNNNLTNNNSVSFVSGKLGQAAQFVAASNQYLSYSNAAGMLLDLANTDFTIALWAQFASLSTNRCLVSIGDPANANGQYCVWYHSGAGIKLRVGNGTSSFDATSLASPAISTWYCIIARRILGDKIYCRVNNANEGSVAVSGALATATGAFYLSYSGRQHDGLMDNVAVVRRAWSDAECVSYYNGGNGLVLL